MEVVSTYAGFEFEFGNAERGRTIMDGLLEKNKKKVDLFYRYLDKEAKFGTMDTMRTLYRRIVKDNMSKKLKWNDKKMKGLFTKWYGVEEQRGDEKSKLAVTQLAKEFVDHEN